jgi:predicted transcriptional regulator
MGLYYISMLNNPLISKNIESIELNNRRSKFQISIEVLSAIYEGEPRPTRIMYACNLSWNSLKETLSLLSAKGYVDEVEDKNHKLYSITSEGRDVLGYYEGLQKLIDVS